MKTYICKFYKTLKKWLLYYGENWSLTKFQKSREFGIFFSTSRRFMKRRWVPFPPSPASLYSSTLSSERARDFFPRNTASRVLKGYLPGSLHPSSALFTCRLSVFVTVDNHSTSINNKREKSRNDSSVKCFLNANCLFGSNKMGSGSQGAQVGNWVNLDTFIIYLYLLTTFCNVIVIAKQSPALIEFQKHFLQWIIYNEM